MIRFLQPPVATAFLATIAEPVHGSQHLSDLLEDNPPLGADAEFTAAPSKPDELEHERIVRRTVGVRCATAPL